AAALALFGATAYFVLSLFREDPLEDVVSTAILWTLGFAVLGAVVGRAAEVLLAEHPELEANDVNSSSTGEAVDDLERNSVSTVPVSTDQEDILH
ncbi:MAG: hypothetical protein V3T77_08525, partial [Planctomycetota bacterium]